MLTVVLAKLSIGLYHRAEFRKDMPKMAGACVVTALIVLVGLIYLGFNIAIIAAPTDHLSEPLYSTPFSYAYVCVSITWLLTNAITDLCLAGMSICSLTSKTNPLSRTERRIWILVIICLGLGCAASWSAITAFIHEISTTTALLQALSYLNRAGGVYIAASSCVTLRRLLHSTSSVPAPSRPTPQTPIVTQISFSHKDTHAQQPFSLDGTVDTRSIRRMTTITIHDDSAPAPPKRPISAVLPETWWQSDGEDAGGEKRHSRRSFYSYKSALATEAEAAAEFDDIAELGGRGSKRFSRRSTKSMGTVDEWGLEDGDYDDGNGKRASGRMSGGAPPLPWEERLDFTSRI